MLSYQTAFAQQERFRIELLVLKHLDGFSETDPEDTLRDFSETLDLMPPPDPEAETEAEARQDTAVGPDNDSMAESSETGEEDPLLITEPEPQAVLVETMSDRMHEAWRRLRLSAGFRPELYFSWEQPEEPPHPLVRIHDQELLYEEDPYADLRENSDENSEEYSEENRQETTNTISDHASAADSDAGDESAEPALPPPNRFYRIDGTAQFRKTRFLHLDLDIEFREPLFSEDVEISSLVREDDSEIEPPRPSAFLLQNVRQSRQVKTTEMLYFDGPVVAVLALITRVEALPEDAVDDSLTAQR